MTPSDVFWEEYGDSCRGEAREALAELVLSTMSEEDEENYDSSNGGVIDALEYALDKLCEYKGITLDEIRGYLEEEECDEDEEGEC